MKIIFHAQQIRIIVMSRTLKEKFQDADLFEVCMAVTFIILSLSMLLLVIGMLWSTFIGGIVE